MSDEDQAKEESAPEVAPDQGAEEEQGGQYPDVMETGYNRGPWQDLRKGQRIHGGREIHERQEAPYGTPESPEPKQPETDKTEADE